MDMSQTFPREHRCDASIGQRADAYGFRPVLCQQIVGTRSFTSVTGLRVTYCSIEGHESNVRRRFVEGRPVLADPEWPGDLPVEPEEKTWTDAGWTESELREAFGA
jgi:hypothetical protein